MKKIAILSGSLSRGGAERVTVYLAEYFNRNGVSADIITIDKAEKEYETCVNRICLTSERLGDNRLFNTVSRLKRLPSSILKLRKYIKNNNYEALLVMGVTNCIFAIPASIGLSTKIIISERNSPEHFDGKRITKNVSRLLMKYGDGFVFQTEDAKKYYSKKLNNQGVVIYNPLFNDGFPERFLGTREHVIVTAGRLSSQKNQMLLINAFEKVHQKYPDYKLDIYGDGPLHGMIVEKIKELHLEESIKLLGNVSDLHSKIYKASCFVLSSNFEGMPNALIEAMALGIPCVSTDCPCGGPRALITNRINGLLVPVNNINEMVNAIEEIISNDELANYISENAEFIRKTLDAEFIGGQWKQYLEELVSKISNK